MAKEWHPDKNDSPDAQTKFIEINAAYEILNDPEKRKRYDNHGVVDDQDRRGNHPENFRHHFRSGSPFDSFFDEGFGGGFGSRGKFCSLNIYLPSRYDSKGFNQNLKIGSVSKAFLF